MRRGRVFKRCKRCGARVPERRCPRCASDAFSWAYVVDVAPPGARRRQQTAQGFPTKSAATEALNRLQVEQQDGTFIEPSRLTLRAYLAQWLETGETRGWAGGTAARYRNAINKHIVPYLGGETLQGLTSMQIQAHYQVLLREGKAPRTKDGSGVKGPLSRRTVRIVHAALRAALNDAVAADPPLLRRNPARGTYSYNPQKHEPEMTTWTVEEVRRFLDFTAGDAERVLWTAALTTGMRRGELLGLRCRDLDLDAGLLHVRQQYTKEAPGRWVFRGLKTGGAARRTIDLDLETVQLLREHLEAQSFARRAWGSAYQTDLDLVFCHPEGTPFNPDVVTDRFERRCEACPDIPRLRFHGLRHTHATLLLEQGETERTVAERLGDQVVMITQLYGHVTRKMRSRAVGRLAGSLFGSQKSSQKTDGDEGVPVQPPGQDPEIRTEGAVDR